jgi:hypothetical protein
MLSYLAPLLLRAQVIFPLPIRNCMKMIVRLYLRGKCVFLSVYLDSGSVKMPAVELKCNLTRKRLILINLPACALSFA